MTRMTTRPPSNLRLAALALVLAACPKPIEPPHEVEPATTGAEPSEPEPSPGPCTYDDDCPRGEICDGDACLLAPAEPSESDVCGVPPLEFARDSARLSPNNQARLAGALACLSELPGLALAACHASSEDAALAERRATSVVGLLVGLGLAAERVTVIACPSPGRSVALRAATR